MQSVYLNSATRINSAESSAKVKLKDVQKARFEIIIEMLNDDPRLYEQVKVYVK